MDPENPTPEGVSDDAAAKQPAQPKPGPADHLKRFQFKKGESGNPSGLRKGATFAQKVNGLMQRNADDDEIDRILGEGTSEILRQADGNLSREDVFANDFIRRLMEGDPDIGLEYRNRIWPAVVKIAPTNAAGEDLESASDGAWLEFSGRVSAGKSRRDEAPSIAEPGSPEGDSE